MIKLTVKLISFVTIVSFAFPLFPVFAQDGGEDACTQLVADALNLSRDACEETGRNQACYGNIILEAEPQLGINTLDFEKRGDLADVESVRSLQLSSMNNENAEWGVAYLQLQANIPDEDEQNVTLLLFGDVGVENAVEPTPELVTIEVTATSNANVRGGPSTNTAIVGSVAFNDTIVANGRLEDNSWVHIQLKNGTPGWIFAQLITSIADVDTLDIVNADGTPLEPPIGPMQAFFVETGVDDAPCEAAPDSGILVQTPEGVAEINLLVNEVDIRLRATAYVQSQPNVEMIVTVIEGSTRVAAQGQSVFVPAGTLVRIPMDATNRAAGPPSAPEAYDELALAVLPIGNLPRLITIAAGLTDEEIAEATTTVDGVWEVASFDGTCEGIDPADGSTVIGDRVVLSTQTNGDIRGEEPVDAPTFTLPFTAILTEDGDYAMYLDDTSEAFNNTNQFRLQILGPNNVDILRHIDSDTFTCDYVYSLELVP